MRWWHLNNYPEYLRDEETIPGWRECDEPDPLAYRRANCETAEEIHYYDGWVWGASVMAESLEAAIARAKQLEAEHNP